MTATTSFLSSPPAIHMNRNDAISNTFHVKRERQNITCRKLQSANCDFISLTRRNHWKYSSGDHASNLKKAICKAKDQGIYDSESDWRGTSPAELIHCFYEMINNRNTKEFDQIISDDCSYEDLSFYKPLQGKEEVKVFLVKLMNCMGKKAKFVIESMVEGNQLVVGVMWHLEWNSKVVPFTKGINFYECDYKSKKLVIRRVRSINESPFKPGDLTLKQLKIITFLFDHFPWIAERFLERPYAAVEWLKKIYSRLIKPFIWPLYYPVMVYYKRLWSMFAYSFGYIFALFVKILEMFQG
ncbi:hypothetical protein AMTR_s00001p00257900 [Amborella trichopoda]|uniref:SnoaL-like domain-containing protein n=2 Tax=Amborella trichopoda TaxID=13333 RepID=W1NLS8_AMBTC|nr:hypothetical protein AMTR_s00001p00257900 [Amborella trichopoda]